MGLYCLCGLVVVKKEFWDVFEWDSVVVCLFEDLYFDINVIIGIFKDYF